METNKEKNSTLHVTSRSWWVVKTMLILSLACNLLPINLAGREPTPEPEAVVEPQVTDTALPIEEEAAPMVPTETPTPEAVATEVETPEPTPTEPALEPAELLLVEVHPDYALGQIILHGNGGDLWHLNLVTGERQLIELFEKDFPDQTISYPATFSDSGRYLAFYDSSYPHKTLIIIYDLAANQEVGRLEDLYPIGWRFGEDLFLVGENTGICDWNDLESSTPNEEVDFLISAYDPETQNSTRLPHFLGSQLNLISLNWSPCTQEYPDPWRPWDMVFSDIGEAYPGMRGWRWLLPVTQDGSRYVRIDYNIHAPEEDGLWVVSIDGETQVEIYREPDKYVPEAVWSPDGDRIMFLLGETSMRGYQWMLIALDGSDAREITANLYGWSPSLRGWSPVWYDNDHLLVEETRDRVDLLNVDTGEVETLMTFLQPGFRIIAWWQP